MSKTFFLADDDADDQDFFAEAVRTLDPSYDCRSASDGEDAVRQLTTDAAPLPDLIFLDLNMPKLNGREVLSHLKGHDALQRVPVVIYTTSSLQKDIDETADLGASFFLTKPTSFTNLKVALRRLVFEAEGIL